MAYILSAKGFTTTITLGRAEAYDILAVTPDGKRTIKIQVKTGWGLKNNTWRIGEKAENIFSDDFYYIFLNLYNLEKEPEFWVVESNFISKYIKERHILWLEKPGLKGQKHNDNPGRSFNLFKDNYTPEKYFTNLNKIVNNKSSIQILL